MIKFIGVLGWALLFVACSTGMQYPFFGLSISDDCYQSGKLVGIGEDGEHEPDLDEPLSNCQNFGDCLVLKTVTYERVLGDLNTCQEHLKSCESDG